MIQHQTHPEPALVVYPGTRRLVGNMIAFGLLELFLLTMGVLAFPSLGPLWGTLMILAMLAPGWLLVIMFAQYRNAKTQHRPSLVVTPAGITVIATAKRASFVPWNQVRRFVIERRNGVEVNLAIYVHDRTAIVTPPPATRPATIGGGRKRVLVARTLSPVPFAQLLREMDRYAGALTSR